MAKDFKVGLSLGGFNESCASDPKKRHNTHVLISSEGVILEFYRKTHLYDVDLSKYVQGGVTIKESQFIQAGERIVPPVEYLGVKVALTICYDLRFPELYRILAMQGADVVLIPSAFMVKTGQAHWETLMRARAIENQFYVIAAAQCGSHNADQDSEPRKSYGHSIAVDPWGSIVGEVRSETEEGSFIVDLDLEKLKETR